MDTMNDKINKYLNEEELNEEFYDKDVVDRLRSLSDAIKIMRKDLEDIKDILKRR